MTLLNTPIYLFAIIAVLGNTASIAQTDSDIQDKGYLSIYNPENSQPEKHIAQSSTIEQKVFDDLTQLTITQTFVNTSGQTMIADYVMPMPNPAALIRYDIKTDRDFGCSEETPHQVVLAPQESVTITVHYDLFNKQLVSFTASDINTFALQDNEQQLAAKQ